MQVELDKIEGTKFNAISEECFFGIGGAKQRLEHIIAQLMHAILQKKIKLSHVTRRLQVYPLREKMYPRGCKRRR